MTIEEKIKDILRNKTRVEQISILEKIGKEIRQQSSIRVYSRRFKDTRVDERPDELKLKGEM